MSTMVLSSVLADNSMHFNENPSGNAILETLRTQRMDGRFCDIVLLITNGTVSDKRFPAHRSVLAACSQHLESVLKTHRGRQLNIGCSDIDVFETLLDYMYSGNITIDWHNVNELLKMSHFLLMSKVINYCNEFLEHYLSVDNCFEVRDLAQKYDCEQLVNTCNEFIIENLSEIIEQPFMTEMTAKKLDSILKDPVIDFTNFPVSQILTFFISWVKKDLERRSPDFYHFLSYIEWQKMKIDFIYDHIDTEVLYKENRLCLYLTLKSLTENNINIERYSHSYNELMITFEKFKNRSLGEDSQSDIEVIVPDVDQNDLLFDSSDVEQIDSKSTSKTKSRVQNSKPTKSIQISAHIKSENKQKTAKNRKNETKKSEESETISPQNRKRNFKGKYSKNEWITYSTSSPKIKQKRTSVSVEEQNVSAEQTNNSNEEDVQNESDCKEEDDEQNEEDRSDEDMDESDGNSSKARNRMQSMSLAHWKEGVKCPHCIYVGHSATRLEQHLSRVHEEDTIYNCKMCSFVCKWNREYYKHMKSHFEGPPYKCEDCDYSCDRIQFILSHRMRHTDERPFECELCAFKSRTKGNLIVHMRIHTGEKPYTCDHCSRSFAMKNTLDQHLATHRDDRPFLCDSCGFTTKYQSHLLSHKRIHTGNVFHCEQEGCTYSSPRRSQLAAHTRSHLSIRSHICSTCGRAFIEKSHLIRHERIHLDEKPFKCEQCDYGSTRRDKLKEHVLKHHTGDQTQKSVYKPRKPRRQNIQPTDFIIESADDSSQVAIVSSPQEIQITQSQLSDQELCTATASLIYEYSSDGLTVSPARVVIQPGIPTVTYDAIDQTLVERIVEQRSISNLNSSARVVIQSNNSSNSNPNEMGGLSAFMALF